MKELWINEELMDLYPDEPVAITKQCNKLNELKDRQADYSNQFKVPPTGNNLRICGFVDRVTSDSINPYTKLACRFVDNGTETISNGVAIIEEWIGGDINITAYSGIFDFFDTIGDKTLRDLDLSDADHIFNLDNVEAGNTSDIYCYPLIQWGATNKDNDIVDIRYQMPCIKVPYLIDKIFEGTGYNKSGDIFLFDSYENLVLPIVEDSLIDEEAVLLSQSVKAHRQTNQVFNGFQGHAVYMNYFGSGDAYNSSAGWYYASSNQGQYIAQTKVTVNIRAKLYIIAGTGFKYWIAKNAAGNGGGAFPNGQYAIAGENFAFNPSGNSGYFETTVENYNLNPGDTLTLWIGFSSQTVTIAPTGALFGNPSDYSSFEVEAVNTIEVGQNLSVQNLVPDIAQKDLLKELAYIYGIVFQIDHLTRTVEFKQFKEISENKYNDSLVVDWSDKLYLSTNPKDQNNPSIKFRFDSYSQKNYTRWKQDDDRAEVGSSIITIDDNTLEKESELFNTVFASSIQEIGFKGDNTGVNIKRYTRVEADQYSNTFDYSAGDYALFNGIVYETSTDITGTPPPSSPWTALPIQYEKTESAAPRILLIRDYTDNGSPPTSSLTYTDGTDSQVITDAKIAYFVDPLQGYDLGFNYILTEHYQELISVLTKTKIVNAKFKLTEADFKNIDFFKPIYISYLGDYFYLNVVPNFISGRLASAELVRL